MALIEFELTKEFRDRFQEALDQRDDHFIRSTLEDVKAADVSSLLYEFDSEESKYVMDRLPIEKQAEIINDLDEDTRKEFLKIYTPSEIAAFVNLLDSDDAADIINELPIQQREEVLSGLETELRIQVTELLRYEDNVAGGVMAKELIKARADWTVVRRLLGSVPIRDLIVSDASKLVADIYESDIVRVTTSTDVREVAEIMRRYDLESIPVVNVQGQLAGRITIDDVVDVMAELAEEERQMMAGITESIEEDDSIWRNARARLPWLLIGILGGILSARIMGIFEEELARITAIAFFVPLIQATGGNVGIQSSSIVVQTLANPGFLDEGIWKRLLKVFLVALLNAFFLSLIVYGLNILFDGEPRLSRVVSIALFSVVIFASLIGTITPLILNRLGFNPALASGPFITTMNDLLGLGIYFSIVHILL